MAQIIPDDSRWAYPSNSRPSQAPSMTSPSNDPLYDALVKYVMGNQGEQGSSSMSPDQLNNIINQSNSGPGGRQWLESLIEPDDHDDTKEAKEWSGSVPATVRITMERMMIQVEITPSTQAPPQAKKQINAEVFYPLIPYNGQITGTLFFRQEQGLPSGPIQVTMNSSRNGGFHVHMSRGFRDSDMVAVFMSNAVPFRFPQDFLRGDGQIS